MKLFIGLIALAFFASTFILIIKRKKNLETGEYYIDKKDRKYYYPLIISFLLAVIIPNIELILDYLIKIIVWVNAVCILIVAYFWYDSKKLWSNQTKPYIAAIACLSIISWSSQFIQEKWIGKPFPYDKISGCCWGVDQSLNDMYEQGQSLEFYGNSTKGTVEAKELISKYRVSCLTKGTYFYDKKNKKMTLQFEYNPNCSFIEKLNGVYIYKYLGYENDGIFKGHRYAFVKNGISFSRTIED